MNKKKFFRCEYITDKNGKRVLIPNCIGSAIYGIDRCTCGKPYKLKNFRNKPVLKIVKDEK
jgi:hypothetical protein